MRRDRGRSSFRAVPPPAAPESPVRPEYLRLVALGALVGIPAGLAAALFLALVHQTEHWLWHDLPDALGSSTPQWYLVLGLPVAGAAIVAAARAWLPGDGGKAPIGPPEPAIVPLSHAPGILIAAVGTLGFGAVLGPEAPIIALGAIVALAVTWFARLTVQERPLIATAGSFSAISALFGGPVVGGVMLTESGIGLGRRLLPSLLPGFVAAAIGYTVFVGLGDWQGLGAPGLAIPNLPEYDGTHVADLLLAGVVGAATAALVVGVNRLAQLVPGKERPRAGMTPLLLAGGFAVGLVALLADGLGADSQDVLFSGQASIPALLAEQSTGILLVLLVAKAIGYAISLGCGFRGGPIFPAVFLGIAVATFPVVWFGLSPTWAVAVGAAAGMAAQTRLLLTAMLFGGLLDGRAGLDAIPAAVLATTAAWIVASALDPR